jgi:hypothetical protein
MATERCGQHTPGRRDGDPRTQGCGKAFGHTSVPLHVGDESIPTRGPRCHRRQCSTAMPDRSLRTTSSSSSDDSASPYSLTRRAQLRWGQSSRTPVISLRTTMTTDRLPSVGTYGPCIGGMTTTAWLSGSVRKSGLTAWAPPGDGSRPAGRDRHIRTVLSRLSCQPASNLDQLPASNIDQGLRGYFRFLNQ